MRNGRMPYYRYNQHSCYIRFFGHCRFYFFYIEALLRGPQFAGPSRAKDYSAIDRGWSPLLLTTKISANQTQIVIVWPDAVVFPPASIGHWSPARPRARYTPYVRDQTTRRWSSVSRYGLSGHARGVCRSVLGTPRPDSSFRLDLQLMLICSGSPGQSWALNSLRSIPVQTVSLEASSTRSRPPPDPRGSLSRVSLRFPTQTDMDQGTKLDWD
ncbi:hypothetical protein RRG08_044606 [Elysia crispata]|uniref:Uncharacterized protein n=1 Tax=Elysia crispata TaxID=231223 RepID=A0AAE0YM04_9GAST|nr:hypothetical protein RRG08_044606 [Elysia crispata]